MREALRCGTSAHVPPTPAAALYPGCVAAAAAPAVPPSYAAGPSGPPPTGAPRRRRRSSPGLSPLYPPPPSLLLQAPVYACCPCARPSRTAAVGIRVTSVRVAQPRSVSESRSIGCRRRAGPSSRGSGWAPLRGRADDASSEGEPRARPSERGARSGRRSQAWG